MLLTQVAALSTSSSTRDTSIREIDPTVGVSFTGLFDYLVHALGSEWLSR